MIKAVVEYPSTASDADSAYEVEVAAFSLELSDPRKRTQSTTLLPQTENASSVKLIKSGGSIRLTYKINFALLPGDYKVKMKSVASNELTFKIATAAKRQ